jgi:hypothetical protein
MYPQGVTAFFFLICLVLPECRQDSKMQGIVDKVHPEAVIQEQKAGTRAALALRFGTVPLALHT